MYRKSEPAKQLDLFSNQFYHLSQRSLKILQNPSAWHNVFYREIISRIDESIFQVLYNQQKGRPNASIRVLLGMMILKESGGWTDRQLFEHVRFNILFRNALGLVNLNEDPPTESTYYDFRKALATHLEKKGEDLIDKVFKQITTEQLKELDLDGKIVRMDSKLINSNIIHSQRLELVVETIRKFIRTAPDKIMKEHLTQEDYSLLSRLKKKTTENFVYDLTTSEKREMLKKMGEIMRVLVRLYEESLPAHYEVLKRVYEEQFIEVSIPSGQENNPEKNDEQTKDSPQEGIENLHENQEVQETAQSDKQEDIQNPKLHDEDTNETTNTPTNTTHDPSSLEKEKTRVIPKDPKDIPSSSIQSPHDTEATYRRKGHGKFQEHVHGFHSNITEVVDDEKSMRLITDIQTFAAHISEDKFLVDAVKNTMDLLQEAHGEKALIEKILTDGGYDSKSNREWFSKEDMPSWRISKNKGTPLMFQMKFNDNGQLEVRLRSTKERVETYFSSKANKYVIKVSGKHLRYMTHEEVERYIAKEQMIGLNKEEAGLRANMESTIHQLFHRLGKKNKVKYRGLIRVNWYVIMRALWVNVRRIVDRLHKLYFFHIFTALYKVFSSLIEALFFADNYKMSSQDLIATGSLGDQ